VKKTISAILLLVMFATFAISQNLTQTVRGTIIDNDSRLPLIGATITIPGSEQIMGTTTDVNGVFRLDKVPIGRISLYLSYVGYEAVTVPNIEVNTGKEVIMDLSMKESVVKLDEVVVMATRKGDAINDMSLLSARSISVEETKRFTGGMDDPARVLSGFAGVAATPTGGSDIIVRGNSPKYLQWRLDGIEISSPYHMNDQNSSTGALTALNNNLLATSDFYSGAFSPGYGDVISGIMDVKLRKGNNEKFEANCGIGLMGTDLTLEGPFTRGYAGSYLVNYRYSTISLLNKVGILNIPGNVDYQDATFKLVLPTRNLGSFSLFGLAGLSGFTMENAFKVPGSASQNAAVSKDYKKSDFLSNLGVTHSITITNNSYVKTSLSYSANGMDDDAFECDIVKMYSDNGANLVDSLANRKQTFKSQIHNSAYRAALVFSNKLNAKNKIQIGAKYILNLNDYQQSIYDFQLMDLTPVTDFSRGIGTLSNFISWKHSLNTNLSFVAGVHNMNVLFNKKSTLEPRIALDWKLNSTNSIQLGYGKHSTMESVHNYFTRIKQTDGSYIEPNKDLDLLKANHYVIGYENRITEKLRAKVEVYYQDLYNLPVENNDTSYYATINEGVDYRYVALVNKGLGKNYGVELTLERFFDNHFYFLINASLFDSKYKSLEGIWRNTQYNGNYLANILLGKEFSNLGKQKNKTFAINTKVFFGGGKKYIPLLRDAQGNVAVDPSHNRYWDYSKAYDKKLDDIFLVNLSVSYKINKPKVTHEIFLDIMNLTNRLGRVSEYYDASKPGNVGYITQFGMFPNLMYRIYF